MTALYIIGGIILFFVIVFSIHLSVTLDYGEKTSVTVNWLFLKIPVYDSTKPKKEKKPKKDKKKPKSEEDKTAESSDDSGELPADGNDEAAKNEAPKSDGGKKSKKKGGNSLLKQLYLDQGYDGIEMMLYNTGRALGGFFGKLFKTLTVDEFYLYMKVVGGDSADTAIKYGKLCAWLYPVLGKLVSTCKVKKYNAEIVPDFLGNKKEATLYAKVRVTPIRITNAAVALCFSLLFKVVFKILFANEKSKKSKKAASAKQPENVADSAGDANTATSPRT